MSEPIFLKDLDINKSLLHGRCYVVDILVVLDHEWDFFPGKIHRTEDPQESVLLEFKLGWVLTGTRGTRQSNSVDSCEL